MEKRKIILDCDPGHDDAVAILLAGINENIEINTLPGAVDYYKQIIKAQAKRK